ncbi:hypothetical protein K438DRAFT_1983930 [Mycena galopus ATCC 62051]|nr:hypothetical protein K438DRAFT_1983930 [Mycena galopus ATCC 62051]
MAFPSLFPSILGAAAEARRVEGACWPDTFCSKLSACCDTRRAARGEDRHYNADEAEFSAEEEYESGGENEVFGMLDTLATADAYQEEDVESADEQDNLYI